MFVVIYHCNVISYPVSNMSGKHFTLNESSQLQQGYSIGIHLLNNTKYISDLRVRVTLWTVHQQVIME
jgi:hypothetical protein